MLNRAKKLLIPFVVLLLAGLIVKVMVGSREELQSGKAEVPLPVVRTQAVEIGNVAVSIVAYGNVRAKHELDLASEVTGRVVWVADNFEPGEKIKAGDLLMRIDPVSYRLALAEAEAALSSAELALADAVALKRKALIAEGKLNIKAAEARIVKAKQDLDYTEIRAPFDAVIDLQQVELGQYITTGKTVARLLSNDAVEVSLPVPSAEVGLLDAQGTTEVTLLAQMGTQRQQWRGTLLRVESRLDSETRVVPVVVGINDPYNTQVHAQELPLGLFVEARIPGKPVVDSVRLPSSAMQPDDSVFLLVDGALARRKVDVAYRQGSTVIVNGGLTTGDLVVVTSLDVMFEGMKVVGAP